MEKKVKNNVYMYWVGKNVHSITYGKTQVNSLTEFNWLI